MLEKPLRRVVEVAGEKIIVELVPGEAGIGAHIKLRRLGQHRAYYSWFIQTPPAQSREAL